MKAWYRLLLRGSEDISALSPQFFVYTAWSTDSFGATKPVRFFMVTSEMLLMSSLEEGSMTGAFSSRYCLRR